jgi:CO/xanthine dehydrogenase Mo-binding subunit
MLAAWHLSDHWDQVQRKPIHAPHIGSHRNADPLYEFPHKRIVKHFVPDSPLRVSAMRGLGAYGNIFAIESFIDELAHSVALDPVEFRLRHLKDERARAVLHTAAEAAGWWSGEHLAESQGRGIAFARYKNRQCYAAIVVDLFIDRESGAVQLKRATISADAGQVVNPDGLSNQLEGGFVQSASWTLKEQVAFDQDGILASDWDSYPILRFEDIPAIRTILINQQGLPFLGSGEAAQGPTPAAIANAIYAAVGVRLRQIPFTPQKVRQALSQQAG